MECSQNSVVDEGIYEYAGNNCGYENSDCCDGHESNATVSVRECPETADTNSRNDAIENSEHMIVSHVDLLSVLSSALYVFCVICYVFL